MSTNYESEVAGAALMEFAEPVKPDVTPDDNLMRYGWSPGADIYCGDRIIGYAQIKRCTLVPFRTLHYKVPDPSQRNSVESLFMTGLLPSPPLVDWPKSARACAEEMRFAYGETNPVGFTLLDGPWSVEVKRKNLQPVIKSGFGFTGMETDEAFELYKLILPYQLDLRDCETFMGEESAERIQGAGLPPEIEEATKAVHQQMLAGVRQCIREYTDLLGASRGEIAERVGTGKGKSRFDRQDERMAKLLKESLTAPPAAVAAPSDPAVGEALKMLAERALAVESAETAALRAQNDLLVKRLAEIEARLPEKK